MNKTATFTGILGTLLCLYLSASPAQAQATRTWVSGVGDDANPCSRTAPCKTFAGAISKTATGGYINCLDPAGYGAVTITKSITIQCDEELGHVLVSGTNGIIVNVPAGSNVTLRGLTLEGINGAGLNGISFIGNGTLHVQEVVINGFSQNGINFAPSGAGTAVLEVSNETLIFGSIGSGILVAPGSGAAAQVSINGANLTSNTHGLFVTGANGGAGVSVRDTVSARNTSDGFQATNGGFITIDKSTAVLNQGVGVHAASGGNILIGNSTVSGNTTGVSFAGATMQSYKNNQIGNNGSDGTPIPAFPAGLQ